ncbi:hypothetical protein Ciccas_000405 [Cichlidogyrus casuarinus]|uniref:Uncharacterized protein n=1 Tax=Cichlidogyrus casuarinus TaxID=1844966 RepID=A0ABD2QN11_9PLAT
MREVHRGRATQFGPLRTTFLFNVLTKAQNRLSGKRVGKLIFMKSNYGAKDCIHEQIASSA